MQSHLPNTSFIMIINFSVSESVDLVFLWFTSPKVSSKAFKYYKNFMKSMTNAADVNNGTVKVAMATYRKRGSQIFDFNAHTTKSELDAAIDAVQPTRARTGSVAAGLNFLRSNLFTSAAGDRPDVPNMIIVVTDANSNLDTNRIQREADSLKSGGNQIFVVGLGVQNVNELKTIASSEDLVFARSSVQNLQGLEAEIVNKMSARKHLT